MVLGVTPQSINRHVDWSQALPLLGMHAQSPILPVCFDCPSCKAHQLYLHNDPNFHGSWFYCRNCRKSGDVIELASIVWNLGIEDTISRLIAEGIYIPSEFTTPKALATYQSRHLDRRNRFKEFWEKVSSNSFNDSKVLRDLQGKFDLRYQEGTAWKQSTGQFVGCCNFVQAEAVFRPFILTRGEKAVYAARTGMARLLVGRGWSDLMVMPFYDLPGRINGLMFIGREGRIPEDLAYKAVMRNSVIGDHNHRNEAGICMYSAIDAQAIDYDDTLYVMCDPTVALRLHSKHYLNNSNTLPIVGTLSEMAKFKTRTVWKNLVGRRVVFWAPKLNAEVFNQAAAINGFIYYPTDNPIYPDTQFNRLRPTEWLHRFSHHCLSWKKALRRHLQTLNQLESEDLISNLEIPDEHLVEFAYQCRPEIRHRIELAVGRPLTQQCVVVSNQSIVERNDTWVIVNSNEVICDATFRIERVISHPRMKKRYYEGTVHYSGRTYPFRETEKVVEGGPGAWLRRFLLDRNAGLLQYSRRWAAQFTHIAAKLHPPKIVKLAALVGWNEEETGFIFPTFTVSCVNGEITPITRLYEVNSGPCPKATAEPLTEDHIKLLSINDPATQVYWSTFIGIMAAVLAPAYGKRAIGLALVGRGAEAVGGVASRFLGCEELLLPHHLGLRGINLGSLIDQFHEASTANNWPLFLSKPPHPRNEIVTGWLNDQRPKNCVTTLTKHQALACQVLGGWNVIQLQDFCTLPFQFESIASRMAAAYLSSVGRRRLRLVEGQDFNDRVCRDVCEWFRDIGGDVSVVTSAIGLLSMDGHRTEDQRFRDLLELMLNNNDLKPWKEGSRSDRRYYFQDGEHRLIPLEGIYGVLNKYHAPSIDLSRLVGGNAVDHAGNKCIKI